MRSLILVFMMGLFLAGCSIHPLPEDVSGDATLDIVQKIKCEAHDAVYSVVQKLLRADSNGVGVQYADMILNGDLKLKKLFRNKRMYRKLDGDTLKIFALFATTAVGFDFTFDMTEYNKNGFTTSFLDNFTRGTFTLGIDASKNLTRNNERTFIVTSTFYQLYHYVDERKCSEIAAQKGNIKYPITGKIGVADVFHTFMDLNTVDPRVLTLHTTNRDVGGGGAFQDKLTFTTKLNAKINPEIKLNAVPGFHLSSASFTGDNTRTDMHSVRIALVIGKNAKSERDAAQIARRNILFFNQKGARRAENVAVRVLLSSRSDDVFRDIRANTEFRRENQ